MALELEIWGYGNAEDAVGIPLFVITVKRGGILLGAYDGDRMAGFVYSLAGLKRGVPMQWSHMLGVRDAYRGTGLGRRLKLEQRRRALDMGIELMEWTFDPLQVVNAHLNFRRLGVVAEEYHLDVYGASPSTLHQGNPTDRFIVQWWMRAPRVAGLAGEVPAARRDEDVAPAPGPEAPVVLEAESRGGRIEPTRLKLGLTEHDLQAVIPGRFPEMLARDPGLAQAWRLASREAFTHYLSRGYTVVDFLRRPDGGGAYRLSQRRSA
jgi:predicted GNAT superfamily acetyltransferase